MIEFLAMQVRLGRVTLEQIEAIKGKEIADEVAARVSAET